MTRAAPDPDPGGLFRAPDTAAEVELDPAQAELAAVLRRTRGDDVADEFIGAIIGARIENAHRDYRRAADPLRAIPPEELRALMLTARDANGARRRAARQRLRDLLAWNATP